MASGIIASGRRTARHKRDLGNARRCESFSHVDGCAERCHMPLSLRMHEPAPAHMGLLLDVCRLETLCSYLLLNSNALGILRMTCMHSVDRPTMLTNREPVDTMKEGKQHPELGDPQPTQNGTHMSGHKCTIRRRVKWPVISWAPRWPPLQMVHACGHGRPTTVIRSGQLSDIEAASADTYRCMSFKKGSAVPWDIP